MATRQSNILTNIEIEKRFFRKEHLRAILDSLRTKQWIKNLLIFAGILFSKNMTSVELVKKSCEAFVLFCLLSSSIYLINDIMDRGKDLLHPEKKFRPIASGRLSISAAITLSAILATCSIICSLAVNKTFGLIAITYFVMMILYSVYLKRIATVDVLIISFGFIMRAIAGTAVINVNISPWLVICSTFLALFMALCKRRHELISLGSEAKKHRETLTQYSRVLLDQFIAVASTSTVICYALYTLSPSTILEYGSDNLVYTVSLVVFAIFRYLFLVYQKDGGSNPEILIVTDIPLLSIIFAWGMLVFYTIYF